MTLKVAIVGASGYAGAEIARLVEDHPDLELVTVTANSQVGARLGEFAEVSRYAELEFVETNERTVSGHDIVFIALPHTKSAEVANWLSEDVLVLDCGADFRLKSKDDYEKYYKAEHPGTWEYGMPELLLAEGKKQRGRISGQRRIAVPGCNATAVTLAYAP
ncbi:MAG: N-acetyl-gamma-glutamyl-phosphate reductase, partial [Rhodoluna sp.]